MYCYIERIKAAQKKEGKAEKGEWALLFWQKEKGEMGHSQLQEAINKMSTVLLTITCSIKRVFRCHDCKHNLFCHNLLPEQEKQLGVLTPFPVLGRASCLPQ